MALPKLPLELIQAIWKHMNLDVAADSSSKSKQSRRCLASCAFACKQWGYTFRPLLYNTIIIKSGKDVNSFLELLVSSSDIPSYVESLRLESSAESGEYWTYVAGILLGSILPKLKSFCQVFVAQDSSLHPPPSYVPMPATLTSFRRSYKAVVHLSLHHYRFRSPSALSRLAGAFTALRELNLDDVSWADRKQLGNPEIFPSHTAASLCLVTMVDCQIGWYPLWLFTGTQLSKARSNFSHCPTFLIPDEIIVLLDLIDMFLGSMEQDWRLWTTRIERSDSTYPSLS